MFLNMFTEKFITGSNVEKELEYMSNGYVPLTPSILQEYEKFYSEVYHITSADNLKTLKKLQGKRKDIPTFTKGSEGISTGAQSGGEILIKMEGYSSFRSPIDFFSQLDRNGLRWLNPTASQFQVYDINNKFSVPMFNKIIIYFQKHHQADQDFDRYSIKNGIKKLTGKEKSKFIKFYFDESKKLLNKKMLKTIEDTIMTTRTSAGGGYDNDEVLLHNFKIIEVYGVVEYSASKKPVKLNTENDFLNWANGTKPIVYEFERDAIMKTIPDCKKLSLKFAGIIDRKFITYIKP